MTSLAWPKVGSIHALALRLTTLDQTGAPVVGAKKAFVSKSLTKITFTPTYTEGQKIEEKNGADQVCVTYQAARSLTGGTCKIEVCSPDPELESILAGYGILVNSVADVVGGASPAIGTDPLPYGVSIEAWSRAILDGAENPALPYIRWVLPRGKGFSVDERVAENAAMKPTYSGTLEQNSAWGNGGFNDWDYASTKLWQYALDEAADFPATVGLVTVPAAV